MFSFFRKSKKDSDSSAGGANKKHKDKENSASPARNHKEMCKNNITIQNVESAPQCANVSVVPSVATEVALPKTVEPETASESGGETEIAETKTKNDDPSENATMSVSSKAQTYSNMLKETSRGGRVKPCGHGTIAVAPKIPLPMNKRDNTDTPPGSPKAEMRNKLPFYKPPNEVAKTELLHKNNGLPKYELVKTQPMNDTVTGVMKLRVDIPSPPVTQSNSTPPIDNAEKYVIKQKRAYAVCWRVFAILNTLDVRFDSLLAPTRFNFSQF